LAQPFVHLHLHTQFSLLDGAIKHTPLFERAKRLGMPAVAMTDHGNLFGAVDFYERALANGVRPLIGCEAYLASGSRFDKEKREHDESGFDAINHQLLLAMNETGYRNLIYLISMGFLEGFYYKPRIDLDLLRERSEGLIATSGCLSSMIPRAIGDGDLDRAWSLGEEFKEIFGDRYYLELQRHGIAAQDTVNAELVKMSADLGLPLVATNDAHYLEGEDHAHHDVLLCIGTASNLDDSKRFRFDGQGFYVKDGDEMRELFRDHPSAVEATLEIAERCDLELEMGRYHLPEFQVATDQTREAVMAKQAWTGLRQRLGLEADEPIPSGLREYEARMKHELDVIQSMGFAGYFLIVADFIQFARRQGIPVGPGRGSAAGSLVAYGLGITGIDPIEYDIIFERFLNPERVSMPDIDVDFCMRGRDQVIRYVAEKYSGAADPAPEQMRVAQIATFGTLQARAAIRDVGRVLGMAYGDVDRVAKLVPDTLGITLDEALARSPELRARVESDGQVARLFESARKLEGLTRHASKHAAGVVIGNRPLIESVPLYRDARSGDIMTQYDMRCVEKIGLIKFDFLGLRTLTILSDAERLIRERSEAEFSLDGVSLEDPATYDLLCRGDTEGVFQVESPGMTDLVVKLAPRAFKELIQIVALYRPGPLGSGMVDDFINRKKGLTPVEYLLPELEELTAETRGVIVYQDQVLQIANRVAGYSLGEADLLRRAMGKKKPKEMAKQRERFVTGAVGRGTDRAKAEQLFEQINEFAGYGFPKAHSTAYALITYQTAYLRAHYPEEYTAALLTVESGNHDKLARYIAHARERNLAILPPDVNQSQRDFWVVDEGIRFGFSGIKNVGRGAIEAILEARSADGAFQSLFDFCQRVDARRVNRRVVESLAQCGAFDSLHPNRAAVWASLDAALEQGAAAQRDREIGQANLFGSADGSAAAVEARLADAAPWTERERLAHEKALLGFYVTGHPLSEVAPRLRRYRVVTAGATAGHEGREVRAGGLLTALRETRTRRGDTMAFATLEDLEGTFDLVLFAEPFARLRGVLRAALEPEPGCPPQPILVTGKLEAGDPPKILARDAFTLEDAEERLATRVRVELLESEAGEDRMQALAQLLRRHPGDCAIQLVLRVPGQSETWIALPEDLSIDASDVCLQAVNSLFGHPVAELVV